MTDVRLDDTDDLYYEGGDVSTVTGLDEVAQSASIAYDTGLGEWAYDTDAGVAYIGVLARPGASDAEKVAELRRVGARIRNVIAVEEVVLVTDAVTRDFTADITLRTPEGLVEVTAS
jgi:hypothetical protein